MVFTRVQLIQPNKTCIAHEGQVCAALHKKTPQQQFLQALQASSKVRAVHRSEKRQRVIAAVAEATREEATSTSQPIQQGIWHAVVANAEFMLHDVQNESFAEQLRERRRLYSEKNQQLDFWLVSEPAWLDERFPKEAKKVRRPCIALVSTDKIWINFMKLRLDRVLRVELGECSLQEVLKSNGPPPNFEPLDRKGPWTAPYPPYRPGWWEAFMQENQEQRS